MVKVLICNKITPNYRDYTIFIPNFENYEKEFRKRIALSLRAMTRYRRHTVRQLRLFDCKPQSMRETSSDYYLMAQYSAAHKRRTAEAREIPLRQSHKIITTL